MSRAVRKAIVFVAGLHGDERLPIKVLNENKIPYILGNPLAFKKNKRFIHRDLNASFGVRGTEYEAKRASEILKQINKNTLVVDFHTTTAKTPPFVIIVNKKMISFAAQIGLKNVVYMKHNIKGGHALINKRDGISVEVGRDVKNYNTILKVIKNISFGKKYSVKIYEVQDILKKPGTYKNFKKHPAGFYPILAGEKAYDFYGLKARLIHRYGK